MKIRNRLSLEFTLLSAGIMLLVFLLIYGLFADYIEQTFFHRLRDRALITAQVFLEKDELTRKSFLEIQEKYLQRLPGEQSFIYNNENRLSFISDSSELVTRELLEGVRDRNESFFRIGGKPAAGINYEDNQGDFVIIVAANNISGQQHLNNLLWVLCVTYVVGLLITFTFSTRFAGKALHPIVHINRKMTEIRSRNLHERVDVPQNKDEINELANNFNGLLSHLEDAFESQRSFVSNASHELRTPLTAIIGELEVALSKPRSQEEYMATMHSVLAESDRLSKILNHLFELTSFIDNYQARFQDMEAGELLHDLRSSWEAKGETYFILVDPPEIPSGLVLRCNQVLLETAFNNLLKNAFKFSHQQPVHINWRVEDQQLRIDIADKGIGIPETDQLHIFEPFFRADNARAFPGNGVGLSITQKIILLHQGTISVSSSVGTGTCFHISLPINTAF